MSKLTESALEDNKESTVVYEENVSETEAQEPEKHDLDRAAKFLADHADVDTAHIDLKKLRRKTDINVIGICCLVFIIMFLDKSIYNVSCEDHVFWRLLTLKSIRVCVASKPMERRLSSFSIDGIEARS
jgi:hypothetical protein